MNARIDVLSSPYSSQSQSFFLGLIEDIGQSLEPTSTQLDTLERSYKSTGEFLVNCSEFRGQLEEVYAQGSRVLGTMTRPLRKHDGYDVDLVARLNSAAIQTYNGAAGAVELINRLHSAVSRYASQHNLELYRWERCVTLQYADGMCADIAPVIDMPSYTAVYGDSHGVIPDKDLSIFLPTNPRGFSKLFNEIASIKPVFSKAIALEFLAEDMRKAEVIPLPSTDVFGRLLCRLIQVMKLHRDVAFSSSAMSKLSPSSIFITALVAEGYKKKASIPHEDQLDLLLDIIRTIPDLVNVEVLPNGKSEWLLDNPTAPGDNLASAMNCDEKQQAFFQWHKKLLADVYALIQSIDAREGFDKVFKAVDNSFGEKASSALRNRVLGRQALDREVGKIQNVSSAGIITSVSSRGHTFFGI